MVELIIIYLLTVILSFFGEMSNAFMIFKDVASAGYKMDIKKMNDISKQMKISSGKNSNIRFLIPIYNVLTSIMEKLSLLTSNISILKFTFMHLPIYFYIKTVQERAIEYCHRIFFIPAPNLTN